MNQNGSVWRTLYNDAVVELDQIKLLQKIEVAQKAIGNRMEDVLLGRLPIDAAERQAIEVARNNLYLLKFSGSCDSPEDFQLARRVLGTVLTPRLQQL